MEVTAKLRMTRISPYKCRLAARLIRGLDVGKALDRLRFGNTAAAGLLYKLLQSAIANAEDQYGADIDELTVAGVRVDQGPTYKRFRARARGRGARILKRTSHVVLTLSDGGRENG